MVQLSGQSEEVRRGEVSASEARTVLPLARGEAEAQWVGRAHKEARGVRRSYLHGPGWQAGRPDGAGALAAITANGAGMRRQP